MDQKKQCAKPHLTVGAPQKMEPLPVISASFNMPWNEQVEKIKQRLFKRKDWPANDSVLKSRTEENVKD